jgi:hypothetical protein
MRAANVRKQTDQFMQGYLNEIDTIVENASDTDKAGKWGLDGWIRTIHDLCDLQVRTFATVLQAGIAAPWWAAESPDEPVPADPIPVKPKNYPRALSASAFRRVGLPGTTIPPYSLGFEPEILPAGATEFRIVLKDDRFLGANYEGSVLLTPTSGSAARPDTVEVIVGL